MAGDADYSRSVRDHSNYKEKRIKMPFQPIEGGNRLKGHIHHNMLLQTHQVTGKSPAREKMGNLI